MDILAFNEASTANGRIENFIENPDSTSGIVTVPKVIATGETVTIPTGRIAVLPNVQIDGTLNIEGEVFIPSGATFSKVVETEGDQTVAGVKTFSSSPIVPNPTTGTQAANKGYVDTKQSKSELAYDVNTSSYISNTLASGAIIERGTNASGSYIKFADGTMEAETEWSANTTTSSGTSPINIAVIGMTFPITFNTVNIAIPVAERVSGGTVWSSAITTGSFTTTYASTYLIGSTNTTVGKIKCLIKGTWK